MAMVVVVVGCKAFAGSLQIEKIGMKSKVNKEEMEKTTNESFILKLLNVER